MRLLADESLDFMIVRALGRGYTEWRLRSGRAERRKNEILPCAQNDILKGSPALALQYF